MIKQMMLSDFKSFGKKQSIKITPLTFLVGENSSGKTSILSGINLMAANLTGFGSEEMLSKMGPFDELKNKNSNSETFEFNMIAGGVYISLSYRSKEGKAHPYMLSLDWSDGYFYSIRKEKNKVFIKFQIPDHEDIELDINESENTLNYQHMTELRFITYFIGMILSENELSDVDEKIVMTIVKKIQELIFALPGKVHVVSPIRTEPERIYEMYKRNSDKNDESPYLLTKILKDRSISEKIYEYGKKSGLFKDIKVSWYKKINVSPFELRLDMHSGVNSNLADVGYGVSQSLPVIIGALMSKKNDLYLVQQPEVHLHPKAQAHMGDFFADMVLNEDKKIVIETHSDFIIDRAVKKFLTDNPEKISMINIVYIENHKNGAQVYNIKIDKNGNYIDAPDSYREFFLDEAFNNL